LNLSRRVPLNKELKIIRKINGSSQAETEIASSPLVNSKKRGM
jgi:hypothetical protein